MYTVSPFRGAARYVLQNDRNDVTVDNRTYVDTEFCTETDTNKILPVHCRQARHDIQGQDPIRIVK